MDETARRLDEFFKNSSNSVQLEQFINERLDVNAPLSLEDGRRPLHVAATQGNASMVQMLLNRRVDVDARNYYGNTALYDAARAGLVEVVRLLLHGEADPNLTNDEGCTILQNAVCFGHVETTRLLLSKGANMSSKISNSSLPLYLQKDWYFAGKQPLLGLAFKIGNVALINELMSAGADVVKESDLLMYIAINSKNIELVNVLLDKGVDIERECIDRKTPLNVAISSGWYDMVQMLLEKGAKIQVWDSLRYALLDGHLDIAKLLVENGAELPTKELVNSVLGQILRMGHNDVAAWLFNHGPDVCATQKDYEYIFYKAVKDQNIFMVHLIIDKLENVNASFGGRPTETALIAATKLKLLPVIEMLLEKGANTQITDTQGDTALSYAVESNKYLEIVKVFLKWGVSANSIVRPFTKTTILHLAASYRRPDLVEFLLLNGADVNAKDRYGCTPFHKTCFEGTIEFVQIMKLLVKQGADLYCVNTHGQTPIDLVIRDEKCYFNKSSKIQQEQIFFEECYEINDENLSRIKTLLSDMIQKLHISLVQLVLHKVVAFYYEERMMCFFNTARELDQRIENSDVEHKDNDINLLHFAAYKGDVNLLIHALPTGENIDALTKEGFTALQIALYKGHTEVAQHLINAGANVSIEDRLGLLPFHVALLSVYDFLLPLLYPITWQNSFSSVFGVPIFHLAAYLGSVSLASFLLSKGLSIDTKDLNRNTILHIAVKLQNSELVEFLLENGIDKNAQNTSGDTALYIAFYEVVFSNLDLEIPKILLRHDVDINIPNSKNETALHYAALTPLAGILLAKDVQNINIKSSYGNSPFFNLADHLEYNEDVPFEPTTQVVLFLNHKADINSKNDNGESPLLKLLVSKLVDIKRIVGLCNVNLASTLSIIQISFLFRSIRYNKDKQFRHKRQYDLMEMLLSHGFSLSADHGYIDRTLDSVMIQEYTSLFKLVLEMDSQLDLQALLSKAIEEKKFHIIKLILDKMDVNTSDNFDVSKFLPDEGLQYGLAQMYLDRVKVKDKLKNFPHLVQVAKSEHLSITKVLLDKGVHIDSVDAQSNTALHYAAGLGNRQLLDLLLSRGALIDIFNKKYETPIHLAAKAGRAHAFKLLMDRGASLSTKDCDGNTLLHQTKCLEIAQILIDRGVPVNARNACKLTALHCIVETIPSRWQEFEDIPKIAILLIEEGAVVNAQGQAKITPLHLAVKNNQLTTVAVLVEKGANINLTDKDGRTALHHAVAFSTSDIVRYLLDEGAPTYVTDYLGHAPHSMSRYNRATKEIFDNYSLKESLVGLPIEDVKNAYLSREEEASCLEELENIKLINVHETFSLFEIFSSFQKPTYLFDEQTVEAIERLFSSGLLNQFPNYKGILKSTYARSKRSRCYLTRQALASVVLEHRGWFFRSLPQVVWMQVFKYLKVEDLENIVESGTEQVPEDY